MADWVHCNQCFHQPGDGRKFCLTSCGHIFCSECLQKATREKCSMCGVPCTTLQLTSKMKPDVDIYFTDPSDIARRHMKQLSQVMDFQKGHRQRLTAYNRERVPDIYGKPKSISYLLMPCRHSSPGHQQLAKHNTLVQKAQKSADLEREIMVLQEENAYLKKLIQSSKGQNRPSGRPGSAGASPINLRTPGYVASLSPGNAFSPRNARAQAARSPYNQENSISSNLQSSQHKSNVSSTRLSVRTPPIQGHMGVIPSTPTTGTHGGGYRHQSNTPGESSRRTAGSPMAMSPSSQVGRPIGLHPGISMATTPHSASQTAMMFATPTQSPQAKANTPSSQAHWDTSHSRRNIQLNYTPRSSSSLNARLDTINRHRVCQQKIHTLKAENANLRSQMTVHIKQLKKMKVQDLNQKQVIKDMESKLNDQKSQLLQAQREMCMLRTSLECMKEQIKSNGQHTSEENAKHKLDEVSMQIESKERSLINLQALEMELEGHKIAQSELHKRCQELNEQVDLQKRSLLQVSEERDIALKQKAHNLVDGEKDKSLIRELTGKCDQLEQDLAERLIELTEIKHKYSVLQSSIAITASQEARLNKTLQFTLNLGMEDAMVEETKTNKPFTSQVILDSALTFSSTNTNDNSRSEIKDAGYALNIFPLNTCDTTQIMDVPSDYVKINQDFQLFGSVMAKHSEEDEQKERVHQTPDQKSDTYDMQKDYLQTPCRRIRFKPCLSSGRKRKFTAVIQDENIEECIKQTPSDGAFEGTTWIDHTPVNKKSCLNRLKRNKPKKFFGMKKMDNHTKAPLNS